MIDENAFGIWVGYHDVEEDEYSLERDEFERRFSRFAQIALGHARENPLGTGLRALDFGHGVFFEIAEGDEGSDPIAWLKALRAGLLEDGFATIAVLSHGSRWVEDEEQAAAAPAPVERWPSGVAVQRVSTPSEPLRRALHADTAARPNDDETGWGPGLYVDTEAVGALGKTLKNAPTPLESAGATFYRVAR